MEWTRRALRPGVPRRLGGGGQEFLEEQLGKTVNFEVLSRRKRSCKNRSSRPDIIRQEVKNGLKNSPSHSHGGVGLFQGRLFLFPRVAESPGIFR